jgi:DNA repair photolyase
MTKTKKVFGTGEWASKTLNFINGCSHDCKYCYAKSIAIRFKRKTSENWKDEEVIENKLNAKIGKSKGTVMFPSTHDIHPDHLEQTLMFLKRLLEKGNKVLIVTKPHIQCVRAICENFDAYKNQILFRFTIGSHNSDVLSFWEPGAPSFEERLLCLKYAYTSGFNTSVSCEPMLDNKIEVLVDLIMPFVTDAIWIGKANRLIQRLKVNGFRNDSETMNRAKQLISSHSEERIFEIYQNLNKIKWKESIKEIIGFERPKEKGIDF